VHWKKEKASGPSIFIAKTYEILEVTTMLFSPILMRESLLGVKMEPVLLS